MDAEAFDRSAKSLGRLPATISPWHGKRSRRDMNSIAIVAFGCRILVVSDCGRALETLDRFLLPSLPRAAPDEAGSEILLRVLCDGDGFQLICNGAAEPARDLRALTVGAVRLIDEAIVARLSNLSAVHAGAVQFGDRALLLPGGTHAGKSALVAELLRCGAVYLSDEYALIDDRGRAQAYPRPLLLRNGGAEQVPRLPEEFHAAVAHAPVPVALQYDAAADWRLAATAQSEALLALLRNTPHVLAETPRVLPALTRASAGSKCYAGKRGDAADAAGHILRLVAE